MNTHPVYGTITSQNFMLRIAQCKRKPFYVTYVQHTASVNRFMLLMYSTVRV